MSVEQVINSMYRSRVVNENYPPGLTPGDDGKLFECNFLLDPVIPFLALTL